MSLNGGNIKCCIYSYSVGVSLFLLFLLVHGGGTCGPGTVNIERQRRRVPLKLREYIPDVHETSVHASGSYTGRVKRGTAAYDALKTNIDPNLVFKEDKGTGDNRRMTKRCERKLQALSVLVRDYWHGDVKVRVIRAYDDGEGKHRRQDRHSLHYAGRAVDITTSDLKRDKFPMLGRLAYEAGFDWVYYASKAYIHASVKSEENNKNDKPGCFHSTSSVQLQNGTNIQMKDLSIGDKVASMDSYGRIAYSPILMFFHRSLSLRTTYLKIYTQNHQQKLTITPTHFIYKLNKQSQRERVLHGKWLTVGDVIYIRNGSNGVTTRPVSDISVIELTGAFAPLTETGNIVVDDVVVSCYAVFSSNTISHWSMLPVRILARFFPNMFNTEEEVHWYPMVLFKLYSFFSQISIEVL